VPAFCHAQLPAMATKTKASTVAEDEAPCKAPRLSPSDVPSREEERTTSSPEERDASSEDQVERADNASTEPQATDKAASETQAADHAAATETQAADKAAQETQTSTAVSEIPETRIRAEVQALLVGVDLAAVTVGELRGRLEASLGLDAGVLSARKSLRRRVSFLVHHEVLKKVQRSADCEKIVKELMELQEYPANARQMLIESLPHALSLSPDGATVLHTHQIRLLCIVQDALQDGRQSVEAARLEHEAQAQRAEEESIAQEAAAAAAAEAVSAANAAFEKEQAFLKEMEDEIAEMTKELEAKKAEASSVIKETQRLRAVCQSISDVRGGPVEQLASGKWETEEDWWEAFVSVQQHLLDTGAESSLLDAATISLRKRPEDRSNFDQMAVSGVTSLLADQLAAAEARVQERGRLEMEAEARAMGAAALMDATRSRAEQQAEALAQARSKQEAAAAALATAEAAVPECRASAAKHRSAEAEAAAHLQRLAEALELLETAKAQDASAKAPEETSAVNADEEGQPHSDDAAVELADASQDEPKADEVVAMQVDTSETSEAILQSPAGKAQSLKTAADASESLLFTVASPCRVPTPR